MIHHNQFARNRSPSRDDGPPHSHSAHNSARDSTFNIGLSDKPRSRSFTQLEQQYQQPASSHVIRDRDANIYVRDAHRDRAAIRRTRHARMLQKNAASQRIRRHREQLAESDDLGYESLPTISTDPRFEPHKGKNIVTVDVDSSYKVTSIDPNKLGNGWTLTQEKLLRQRQYRSMTREYAHSKLQERYFKYGERLELPNVVNYVIILALASIAQTKYIQWTIFGLALVGSIISAISQHKGFKGIANDHNTAAISYAKIQHDIDSQLTLDVASRTNGQMFVSGIDSQLATVINVAPTISKETMIGYKTKFIKLNKEAGIADTVESSIHAVRYQPGGDGTNEYDAPFIHKFEADLRNESIMRHNLEMQKYERGEFVDV